MSHPYSGPYKRITYPGGAPCWRCGKWCDKPTKDHRPPLATHDHATGSGCCVIEPACARCNYSEGGRIGGRRPRRSRQWVFVKPTRAW